MQHLSFEELDRESDTFDALVARTPDIDLFCSSTCWIFPAREAFAEGNTSFVHRTDNGYIALAKEPERRILMPLELSWGFPSALISDNLRALAGDLEELLSASSDWNIAALGGIVRGSCVYNALIDTLGKRYRLLRGQATRRYRASLDGGLDGFLSRRSRDFRKNLRRAWAKANERGITFVASEPTVDPDTTYDRLLAIDVASWKGREGVGLMASSMHLHYRGIVQRLAARGTLRLYFATHEGHDIAYILGGVFAKTYRGLQFAYNADYADIGLGNLAQLVTIEALAHEGIALYDLGSDVDYKAKWGEEIFETMTVLVTR